ncbi:MAG: glycoside hydrolase family 13 protein [Clostridiaceae bacterium]|nr:glycoside hydrolase family 13 protein [Clostridiaceae bacterium]
MDGLDIYYNSQDISYKMPFGAVEAGTKVKLSIKINKEINVALELILPNGNVINLGLEKEYLNHGYFKYSVEIDTSKYIGALYYYFVLMDGYDKGYYGNNDERLGGVGQFYRYAPIPYQLTVFEKFKVPEWYKEGVIYQIFVDRFFNGNEDGVITCPKKNSFIYGSWYDTPMYIKDNSGKIARWDFFGGNLKGIIKKLDYIKSLGASIIYLNPIFESSSCHKYDTGNYEKIDSMFGTNDEFKLLCDEAKKRNIRIILDGVFSHTGSDSKYFNKFGNYDSLGAYQSKESKYFKWYRFKNYPNEYESWWGIDTQPNVEELEPTYIDYIVNNKNSIIKKWMRLGASGWRLDVADELPDKFIREIKRSMNEEKVENVLIGEVWEDASNKVSYSEKRAYLFGKELDSVTNYPLRENLINFVKGYIKSDVLKKRIMSLYENYPRESFYSNMNIVGTHDTERILTIVDKRVELLKVIVTLQMMLPGVPLVFYGDEAGVEGGKDPDNRKTYPWGKENKDILDFYKEIIRVRNNEKALRRGDLEILDIHPDVCILKRVYGNEKIMIIVNVSENEVCIKDLRIEGKYTKLLNTYKDGNNELSIEKEIVLKKHDFMVLKKN